MYSLATRLAYEEKQAAYQAMDAARKEMNALNNSMHEMYLEIGQLQADFDVIGKTADDMWDNFMSTLNDYDKRISDMGCAVQEAKDLSEKFEFIAQKEESQGKKSLYESASEFFREKSIELKADRATLIEEKKAVQKPDTSARDDLRNTLKEKRAEHKRLKDCYADVKENFFKKKELFRIAQDKYYKLKEEEDFIPDDGVDDNERRNKILKAANIAEQYWPEAVIREDNEIIHIYYGGDESYAHGHVVLKGNDIDFVRKPRAYSQAVAMI